MKVDTDDRSEERFERAWKAWLERPPRATPSEAAERVTESIRHRRDRHRVWRWSAAAAALVVATLAGVSLYRVGQRPPEPAVTATEREVPTLGCGEVLLWLDDDTPLYMTFFMPQEETDTGGAP